MNKIKFSIIVVGAIIVDKDKILIVQRSQTEDIFPGLWELPSGKVEEFEKPEEALIREVKEETALDIEIFKVFGDFEYQALKNSQMRQIKQINFLVTAKNIDQLKLSSEHQAYKWISQEQINDFDISDQIKKVLRQAFDQLPSLL